MKILFDCSHGCTSTENRTYISLIMAEHATHAGFKPPVDKFRTPIPS